ncbi:MAG: ligand-binding sensor domain-containing protein [Planctomycetota bacterium]|jgi:streptogramin lyase
MTTRHVRRAFRAATLVASLATFPFAATAVALQPSESWSYLRPGNTGIQGDWCEALWIGPDGDPYIAGYNPYWEDGGFAKFVQAENRWENFSTVDYPEIGSRHDVGAARVNDITQAPDGKLWMATWLASPHTGGRTHDVEVAPDGTVWVAIGSPGGLMRYEPTSGLWTFWGSGTTANGWPSGTFSCDDLAVQPKPGGGYTVWVQDGFWGTMITFDSATQLFTELPDTGHPGQVLGIPDRDAVDDAGNMWAWRVAPSGGLATVLDYRRPDGTWVSPPQVGVGADGFKAYGDGRAVGADGNNVVWRFNGTSWQNLGQWKTGTWTYAVDIDAAGNVWACGIGGAARRDEETGVWQRYRVTNTAMLDYFTRDLDLDGQGGVWMTGNASPGVGGFQHFDGTRWFNYNDLTYGLGGPWGFPTDNVDAIAMRPTGEVVINPMFNGIHEWTGSQYVNLVGTGTADGLAVDALDRVWCIGNYYYMAYHDGVAWIEVEIAGWGANVQLDPDVPGMVWALANFEVVRTDGTYYFSRETIDFPPFTPTSGTFTTVAAAPDGVAWVGSTKGLFRVDSNTGDFDWYHPDFSPIPGNQISPMAVTPDGRVWFTNQGTLSQWPDQGIGWFDGTDFGYIPQTEVGVGLPHAQIADMEVREIPGGYELWISCTSEGIAILTVMTDPIVCQPDLGFGGPGTAVLSVCGDELSSGGLATLSLTGAPASSSAWILASAAFNPSPFKGGTLVTVPVLLSVGLPTDGSGAASLPGIVGGFGPLDVYVQAVTLDPGQPLGYGLSNAVRMEFLP